MRGAPRRAIATPTTTGIVVPAELLAEQQRTKRIFDIVMVALTSSSLLVGGIGIMNIMSASVLERTPEIGLRRALGATRVEVVRQFVLETTLSAMGGGILGLLFGGDAVTGDRQLRRLVDGRDRQFAPAAGLPGFGGGRAGVQHVPGDAAQVESDPGASLRVRGQPFGAMTMQILLLSMPDSFEHTPTLAIRMPNGALASLAGNVDPHHGSRSPI